MTFCNKKSLIGCHAHFVLVAAICSLLFFAPDARADATVTYTMPDCSKAYTENDLKKSLKEALEYGTKAAAYAAHAEMSRAEPVDIQDKYCINELLKNYFVKISDNGTGKASSYINALLALDASCSRSDQLKGLCIPISGIPSTLSFSSIATENCNASLTITAPTITAPKEITIEIE